MSVSTHEGSRGVGDGREGDFKQWEAELSGQAPLAPEAVYINMDHPPVNIEQRVGGLALVDLYAMELFEGWEP